MIDIQGLGFAYPGQAENTLCGIDLHIPAGSLFGLLGPNGAGKSTLLNILSGLLAYQHGEVRIDGLSVREQGRQIKTFCALVPQDLAFYPQLTGLENLRFFARILGLAGSRAGCEIDRCIAIAQLEKHMHKRAGLFSGGLKRRLNLAIGLLNNPRLIFLDEPTVGVDTQSRHFLLESIRTLNQQYGTTVVYTSHYMEEVQSLCDRLAIIDHGRICLDGTLDTLLQQQAHGIKVSTRYPLTPAQLLLLQSHWPKLLADPTSRQLSLADVDNDNVLALLQQVQAMGASIDDIHYGGNNRLEDVFLDITQRQLRD